MALNIDNQQNQHQGFFFVAGTQALTADLDIDDHDSALGSSIADSGYSQSMASSIVEYIHENGRRYHAYRAGEYLLPNDDVEQERLDMMAHIYRMITGGAMYRAPITQGRPPPQRVLDVGTGTGIWALEMAEEFEGAVVIGTDLSPIQPGWAPPNCRFYIDDFESDWNFLPGEQFDFIHGRSLCGSIADWPFFFAQAYQNTKPGGYLEMQEHQLEAWCDDNSYANATAVRDWCYQMEEASKTFGKEVSAAHRLKQYIQDAGFVDVHEERYKVPIGPWAQGKKMKEIGTYLLAQSIDAIEPHTLGMYTRVLGYTEADTVPVIAGVRADLKNPNFHMYIPFYFIYGRRPE